MKRKVLLLVTLLFSFRCFAQEKSIYMDFRAQKISDIIYSIADIFEETVYVDETVTGTATFHFDDTSFESALNHFADYCQLYVEKQDKVYYVSKVKIEIDENKKLNINTENVNLYHYAGNNPVRYLDPDGNEAIDFNIKTMQNYSGNIPNSTISFSESGCTFATMTGIIDDFRARNNMPEIDWQEELDNGALDDYFVSEKDIQNGVQGQSGDLKRDKFLKDFSNNKLKIIEDTRENGNSPESTAEAAITNDKKFYIVGRAKIKTSKNKSIHEIGITSISDNYIEIIDSSINDSNRKYHVRGNVDMTNGILSRIIIIGE